jgi:hypothetical protein
MRRIEIAAAIAGAAFFAAPLAQAADHLDGPAATLDPAADITDVYTWLDGDRVVFVLNVAPKAMSTSQFSDKVQYVLHTSSGVSFGATAAPMDIIATFDASQKISLWVGADEYVTGDASQAAGLMTDSGKVKVFAGLREDPFFFNLDGFKATVSAVEAAASMLTFDGSGCPALDQGTSTALVTQLKSDPTGAAGKDFFAGLNVLSIVVSVDKSLVTSGGPVLAVWGSTHKGSLGGRHENRPQSPSCSRDRNLRRCPARQLRGRRRRHLAGCPTIHRRGRYERSRRLHRRHRRDDVRRRLDRRYRRGRDGNGGRGGILRRHRGI